jgi:hypothetical protein
MTAHKASSILRRQEKGFWRILPGTTIGTGLGKIWSSLTGGSRGLLDLNVVQAGCTLVNYSYVGLQTVPLRQIRGSASASRCHDFDANFRPLRDNNKSRWAGVSTARQRGVKLPPVSLIQVGEVYFVEDGHHRISVAKARGEKTIEAEVVVWQVSPNREPALEGQPAWRINI